MKMNRSIQLLIAAVLIAFPGCDKDANVNRTDGVKDALDSRPHEDLRDTGEEIGDAVKDASRDIKDAVNDN